jgi:oligopeptide/dipeptide ABC transporter ATP-binding protein
MTSLNPVLKVGYQIREVITTHLRVSRKEADDMTLELLKAVRIPSPETRMREYPHQMSGGMRQRIMMAMAIACGPSLLIADEPTTALDVTIEAQLLELLRVLREEKNMAVLLITHDLGIIAENAEKVGIMYAGRLVELAGVKELFETPMHPYTMGLLKSLPKKRGVPLEPIAGSVPRPESLPHGCKFSDRCPFVIPRCREEEPALRRIELKGGGHLARCIRVEEIV